MTSRSRIPRVVDDTDSRRTARQALIDWRVALGAEASEAADLAIAAVLGERLPQDPRGVCLGAYLPIRGEPDLRGFLAQWVARGGIVGLPRVPEKPGPLDFGRWTPGSTLVFDRFGVAYPHPFEPVVPDLLLVPCVGFDAQRFRLGYGGGYYDRTLARHPARAIGVAYDEAEIAEFRPAAHDVALDEIVTEKRVLRAPQ